MGSPRDPRSEGLGAAFQSWDLPLAAVVALVPAAAWWVINMAFYTLGLIHSGEVGYRAWLYGLSSFPRWFQSLVAWVSPACWISALIVAGSRVTLHGRRAWPGMLGALVVVTMSTMTLVFVGSSLWRYART